MIICIGINGFGCIGCLVMCVVVVCEDIEVVVINDLLDIDYIVYFLKYDLIYGLFDGEIKVDNNNFVVNGKNICIILERDFVLLKWNDVDVDVVVEFMGLFLMKDIVVKYIEVGVKKVVMFVLFKDDMLMFVMGVNYDSYEG